MRLSLNPPLLGKETQVQRSCTSYQKSQLLIISGASLWTWAVNSRSHTPNFHCLLPASREVWKAKDGGITSWDGQGWVGKREAQEFQEWDREAIEAGEEQVFIFPIREVFQSLMVPEWNSRFLIFGWRVHAKRNDTLSWKDNTGRRAQHWGTLWIECLGQSRRSLSR